MGFYMFVLSAYLFCIFHTFDYFQISQIKRYSDFSKLCGRGLLVNHMKGLIKINKSHLNKSLVLNIGN